MNAFHFWRRWLATLSWLIAILGIAFALFNQTALFDALFNDHIDPSFWPAGRMQPQAVAFQGWAYGVMGALMAAWGVIMAFVAHYPYARRERWAWRAMALAVLVWFIPDTALAVAFGLTVAWTGNIVLLLLFAVPLLATRGAMQH